jgi:hypothetical protein
MISQCHFILSLLCDYREEELAYSGRECGCVIMPTEIRRYLAEPKPPAPAPLHRFDLGLLRGLKAGCFGLTGTLRLSSLQKRRDGRIPQINFQSGFSYVAHRTCGMRRGGFAGLKFSKFVADFTTRFL